MKFLAGLLIAVCLVLGSIAAVTAYLPEVESIDPADQLQLAAPAGTDPEAPDSPLLDPATGPVVLTGEVLARLSDAGVRRVRVKSFSFNRWSHRYLFLLSCLGLVGGAVLLRRENRRHLVTAEDAGDSTAPEEFLRRSLDRIQSLRDTVGTMEPSRAREEIVTTLDDLIRGEFDAFVHARPLLVGRLGMTGYARLMDRFAAAERQLNRAWSAAADHVLEESLECLADGEMRLQETLQTMTS